MNQLKCELCDAVHISPGGPQGCSQECGPDLVSNAARTECVPCPDRTGRLQGATECTRCQAGTRYVGMGLGCQLCPINTISNHPGATVCEHCPAHHTSNKVLGGTACVPLVLGLNLFVTNWVEIALSITAVILLLGSMLKTNV